MHQQTLSELQRLQLEKPQKSLDYDLNESLKNIPNMGCHLILDFNEVTTVDMNDYNFMHEFLTDVIVQSGGTIEGHQYKQFEPQGLTILYLLSESHFSIHTWPENGACAIDFYHCGETASKRLKKAEELLCDKFGWDKCTSSLLLDRGLRRKHQLNSYNNQTTIFSNLMLVERQKSEYQDIRIYDSKYFGRILTLNNMIQVVSNSPSTEFNKTLVDPVFKNLTEDLENRQVIMMGGGDLVGAAYILQKYSNLKKLVVVEIDEKVHALSKQYILNDQQHETISKALEAGQLEIQFADGIQYIQQLVEQREDHIRYDGLIIDCADMLQQFDLASSFLNLNFYQNVREILKPNSIFSHMLSNDKFKRQFQEYMIQAQFREHFFKTAFQPEFSMPVPIGFGISP